MNIKNKVLKSATIKHKYSNVCNKRTYIETAIIFKTVDEMATFLGYLAMTTSLLSEIRINMSAKSFYIVCREINETIIQHWLIDMIEDAK